jgi:predicted NBD/HSP70 family sugar kinase
VRADFAAVLEEAGLEDGAVLGVGIGVPGPVDYATGRPTSPPIMPGWDGFPIRDAIAAAYDAPVLVDNDVNVMALGEHRAHLRELDHILFVKVATGIGAGIIANGEIYRGAHAAAGDIGHTRSSIGSDVLCTCGNRGCIGALASGSAIARQLAAAGIPAASSGDVVRLVHERRPEAVQHVRDAGRLLGDVLAGAITLLAPSAIVIGGEMAEVHEPLLAGIRSRIYERALPLVTRELTIVPSRLGARAGIAGAATLAIEHLLAPEHVDGLIARRTAVVARR